MLHCLGARERRYPQGSAVLRVGDVTTCMGLVLEGAVRLEKEDYWGNRTILASFGPGQSFAEVYACEPGFPLDLNVVAAEDALVLLMDVRRVTSHVPCVVCVPRAPRPQPAGHRGDAARTRSHAR